MAQEGSGADAGGEARDSQSESSPVTGPPQVEGTQTAESPESFGHKNEDQVQETRETELDSQEEYHGEMLPDNQLGLYPENLGDSLGENDVLPDNQLGMYPEDPTDVSGLPTIPGLFEEEVPKTTTPTKISERPVSTPVRARPTCPVDASPHNKAYLKNRETREAMTPTELERSPTPVGNDGYGSTTSPVGSAGSPHQVDDTHLK